MDDRVEIQCRTMDVDLVERAIAYACTEYVKKSGVTPKVSINKEQPLPAGSAGGIIVLSHNGRIRCDNTLETRLEHAMEKMLPKLREHLFGNSPNRRFFD